MTDKEKDYIDLGPVERFLEIAAKECAGEYPGFEISEEHVRQVFERALEKFGPHLGIASRVGATFEMGRETGDLEKRLGA